MDWDAVCDKWTAEGYDALTEPEQVWLNTRGFIDSVNNGGLVSFFYNSYAEHYDDTVFALGELNAHEAINILESYGKLFGDRVPRDIDERNRIISSWKAGGEESVASENVDEALYALFDVLQEQLDDYLLKHGFDPD